MIPLTFNADGTVALGRKTLKRLDDAVPDHPSVQHIVHQVYYRKPVHGAAGSRGKTPGVDPKTHEELMEGLKRSPEAFMEEYRKTHKDAVVFPPEIFNRTEPPGGTAGKGDAP
jgi:hypothetical protein